MIVAALYKFVTIEDPKSLQTQLKDLLQIQKISGTLLLAEEGINGTVFGSRLAIDALKDFLHKDSRFDDMEYKESFSDRDPFHRMKVKIKKEIVSFGQPHAHPHKMAGTYVDSKDWDRLVDDPEVTVLDVRNFYEVEIGKFKNTLDPKIKTFREFPLFVKEHLDPRVNKKIAMSCTGGIRCEKASSYLKGMGFPEVYHLKGGILKYLETVPKEKSRWAGECFVFDHRITVDHDLQQGSYDLCFGCRLPISSNDKASPNYQKGIACPRCIDQRSAKQKNRALTRHIQLQLAQTRGEKHLGQALQRISN
jgi:UPF0176 protein